MRRLLVEALEADAVGLSTGREYRPGCHADTGEVVDLARALGDYGGLYVSHMRNESDAAAAAVAELIEIGLASCPSSGCGGPWRPPGSGRPCTRPSATAGPRASS